MSRSTCGREDEKPSERVGAAFYGQARQFHTWLLTACNKSLERLRETEMEAGRLCLRRRVANVKSGARRLHPLRPETLIELERTFRLVPADGSIWRVIQRDKKTLSVANFWLIPGSQTTDGWDEGENELILTIVKDTFGVDALGSLHGRNEMLACISLHAIARWYARAFTITRTALMADLLMLATFAERTPPVPNNDFRLETGNGGAWRGGFRDTGNIWANQDPDAVQAMQQQVQVRTFC